MNASCGPGSSLAVNSCRCREEGLNFASQERQLSTVQHAIISPRMLELKVVAESAGYDLKDVPADGDCMFSAISVSLQQLGMHYSAQELRQRAAEHLRENPFVDGDINNPRWNYIDAEILQLKPYVAVDRKHAWNLYLTRIEKCYSDGGICGDEMTLKACSDMLEVKVNVYRYDGMNFQPYGSQYNREIALGYVTYDGRGAMAGKQVGQHYSAFLKSVPVPRENRSVPQKRSQWISREKRSDAVCSNSHVTGVHSSKLFSSNVLVCGKARRQTVRDVRSVPTEMLKSREEMDMRKQAEVDNDGFHMVQRLSQRRKSSQPNGELSVKCRRTVHHPEIGTRC